MFGRQTLDVIPGTLKFFFVLNLQSLLHNCYGVHSSSQSSVIFYLEFAKYSVLTPVLAPGKLVEGFLS